MRYLALLFALISSLAASASIAKSQHKLEGSRSEFCSYSPQESCAKNCSNWSMSFRMPNINENEKDKLFSMDFKVKIQCESGNIETSVKVKIDGHGRVFTPYYDNTNELAGHYKQNWNDDLIELHSQLYHEDGRVTFQYVNDYNHHFVKFFDRADSEGISFNLRY